MIVSQAEIVLITNAMHRRQMRLPAPTSRCPVVLGRSYKLQARGSARGQLTITVTEPPRREKLAAITLADARREGFGGIQGAIDAWTKANWPPRENELVWVVSFARDEKGETAAYVNQDDPVYMDRRGGYTVRRDKAMRGESEVLMPLAVDLAKARAKAFERRVSPQRALVSRMQTDADTLKLALTDMKLRNRARRIAHDLARLSLELPSIEVVDSGASVARDEPHMDAA